jgi:hypothetical protein
LHLPPHVQHNGSQPDGKLSHMQADHKAQTTKLFAWYAQLCTVSRVYGSRVRKP